MWYEHEPEAIKQLQNEIYRELIQVSIGDILPSSDNVYSADEFNRLSGLNLASAELSDLSCLMEKQFRHLTHLELSNNDLKNVSVLEKITDLRHLFLNNNQISDIKCLRKLTRLTNLHLHQNQLKSVKGLEKLKQLEVLYLDNNQIKHISPLLRFKNLKQLDLSHNRITHLPEAILDLNLNIGWEWDNSNNGIFLEGNPLESPPIEVVKQGNEAVRNYFESVKKESVRLLETKLLIVGNGEVGKTTLMHKLKDRHFELNKEEPTTHGINIVPWELACPFPDCKDEKIKIHIWDFGGQAIYHSTHQFFLTKRSLYIFVWEARKEEEAQTFDYWFRVIEILSQKSPVIVVMNKSDVRIKHLDEANFKDKFDNIVTFLQISCLTSDGMEKLTERIRRALGAMPHLQDLLPKVWKDIRDRLNQDERDYINLEEYFDICAKFHMDREKSMFLSDYLHDLGVILHYHDSVLENTVILNPEWATEAVYNLIDTREIQVEMGRFQFENLKEYWDNERFPIEKHHELVRLMEKFELCFRIVGTDTYIIPELLPPERPAIDFLAYQSDNNLRFQYNYDFMPGGIISRFISRVYYLIKEEHYWKNGVELRFEQATALVKSEPLDRKLTVSVSGREKSDLLAIIRNELEHIHATLNMEKNIHYKELVPCVCSECLNTAAPYYHKYSVLKTFRDKGKDTVECHQSAEDVSINRLLKGVEREPGLEKLELLPALLDASRYLQGISKSIQLYEDSRNDFITALLTSKGVVVKDQSRWGVSATGKTIGRPDFRVFNPVSGEEAVVEAFNLASLATREIDLHLKKLFNYDASGLERNFVLVYCDTEKFTGLWQKYLDHIPQIQFEHRLSIGPEEQDSTHTETRLARAVHIRSDRETEVFHIFINMS